MSALDRFDRELLLGVSRFERDGPGGLRQEEGSTARGRAGPCTKCKDIQSATLEYGPSGAAARTKPVLQDILPSCSSSTRSSFSQVCNHGIQVSQSFLTHHCLNLPVDHRLMLIQKKRTQMQQPPMGYYNQPQPTNHLGDATTSAHYGMALSLRIQDDLSLLCQWFGKIIPRIYSAVSTRENLK